MRQYCSQVIIENFFEPCILYLLLKKSSYGYDMQKQLKENCSCDVNIGNLYRCLARMQKAEYITRKSMKSEIGPKRFEYTITTKGKSYLAGWIRELEKQSGIINLLVTNYKKII